MTAHLLDRLSPYLDGELSPPEVAAVRAHLRDCSECARQLEELAAVDDLARGLAMEASAGYFESFPARLREKLPQRAPGPRRLPMWALAAAAVLLVAVITPLTLRQRSLGPLVAEMPRAVESPAAPSLAPKRGLDRQPARGAVGAPPASEAETDKGQPETKEAGGSGRVPAKTVSESVERDVLAKREAPMTAPPAPAPQVVGAVAPGQTPGTGGGRQSAPSTGGPWAQDQTRSQTPSAFAPQPADQPADEARRNERALEDKAGVESAPAKPEGERVEARTTLAVKEKADAGFESLRRARRARTATEARALSAAWRRLAAENPSDPRTDEAWVAAIEAGARAFRLGREPADRAQVEADAKAYLTRPDPVQADRVKALLASLDRF